MQLTRYELCKLVPHHGDMCLLDAVEFYDEQRIVCISDSHRKQDNPLRSESGLSCVNGIEYAAQAAAVHSTLKHQQQDESSQAQGGVLVQVRRVTMQDCDLSQIAEPLDIEAICVFADSASLIYSFTINHQGNSENTPVISGRLTIFLIPGDKVK